MTTGDHLIYDLGVIQEGLWHQHCLQLGAGRKPSHPYALCVLAFLILLQEHGLIPSHHILLASTAGALLVAQAAAGAACMLCQKGSTSLHQGAVVKV